MIKTSAYIQSIVDLKDEPGQLPQILFLGRSNVGKSSFINALARRKNLARTSNTPGKTIALNFYLINEAFYFVDAPGYGYARRSKSQKDEFIVMLEKYLLYARNLKAICLLIDFKVGPTKDDLETYHFVKGLGKEVFIIATKLDKIPKTHRAKQLREIQRVLNHPNHLYVVSNTELTHIDQIRDLLLTKINGGKIDA